MKTVMSVLLLGMFLAISALPYAESAFGRGDPAASAGETLDSEDNEAPDPSGSTPGNVANKELELPNSMTYRLKPVGCFERKRSLRLEVI